MANVNLCNTLTHDKLKELGFVYESDGTGSPWGCDVKLSRIDVDTDFIEISIDSVFDLEMLVAWVS